MRQCRGSGLRWVSSVVAGDCYPARSARQAGDGRQAGGQSLSIRAAAQGVQHLASNWARLWCGCVEHWVACGIGAGWCGLYWVGFGGLGLFRLGWARSDWVGLGWVGSDWVGLGWSVLNRSPNCVYTFLVSKFCFTSFDSVFGLKLWGCLVQNLRTQFGLRCWRPPPLLVNPALFLQSFLQL